MTASSSLLSTVDADVFGPIGDRATLLPLLHRRRAVAVASRQRSHTLLTILDRSTHRLHPVGAAMEDLVQNSSLQM